MLLELDELLELAVVPVLAEPLELASMEELAAWPAGSRRVFSITSQRRYG